MPVILGELKLQGHPELNSRFHTSLSCTETLSQNKTEQKQNCSGALKPFQVPTRWLSGNAWQGNANQGQVNCVSAPSGYIGRVAGMERSRNLITGGAGEAWREGKDFAKLPREEPAPGDWF